MKVYVIKYNSKAALSRKEHLENRQRQAPQG